MFAPINTPKRGEAREGTLRALLAISRGIDAINRLIGRLAVWAMLSACVISFLNALSRYAFSRSSNFWLEIQWYFFGAMFMLAAGHVLKLNEHVRVDLLYGALGHRKRLWIDAIGTVLFLMPACLVIGYLTFEMFWEALQRREESANAQGLLLWPALAMFPLGFALLFLQALSELIKRIEALHGDIVVDTSYEKPVQ